MHNFFRRGVQVRARSPSAGGERVTATHRDGDADVRPVTLSRRPNSFAVHKQVNGSVDVKQYARSAPTEIGPTAGVLLKTNTSELDRNHTRTRRGRGSRPYNPNASVSLFERLETGNPDGRGLFRERRHENRFSVAVSPFDFLDVRLSVFLGEKLPEIGGRCGLG